MPVRVWSCSNNEKYQFVTLTPKYLRGALDVMRNSFNVHETVSVVSDLAKSEKGQRQFEEVLCAIAEDGISIVAVEVDTDTVVGVAFNKVQVKGVPEMNNFLNVYMQKPDIDPAFREILYFVSKIEEKVDIYGHYGITKLVDHMFLATHVNHFRQGIGRALVVATQDITRALNQGEDVAVPISEDKYPWKNKAPPRVEAVIALFTSPKSQKIGISLGWDEILITSYDTLFFQGKPYSSYLDPDITFNAYMALKM